MVVESVKVKQELDTFIQYEIEDKQIPSISYAVIDGDKTVCSDHLRWTGAESIKSLSDATIFRVGSCSKMFTAMALMQQVEKGRIDIDADISEVIPWFCPKNPFIDQTTGPTEGDKVTLRKLMSHTSGLVREPTIGHYLDDRTPSLAEVVDSIKDSPLKDDPKANVFHYSNAGIAVVGYVIEQITGVNYNDYIQQQVLDRIGMKDSSFVRTAKIDANLASANMWSMDGDFPAPVFDMGGAPAGNLFATLPDMAEFMKVLVRGGYTENGRAIVTPATLHAMWEAIGFQGKLGYGLGFAVTSLDGWRTVGHSGAVYGFSTQCVVLPEAQLGIVLCSTLDATNAVISRIGQYALRLLLAAKGMGKEPPEPILPEVITERQLSAFAGFYHSDERKETVEVKAKDGKLYLMGGGVPLRIQPLSESQFIVNGRVFGPGSEYPHLDVSFALPEEATAVSPAMTWKGIQWKRVPKPVPETVPGELQPYIGEYGPDFNPTHILYQNGKLECLIEYFYTHTLERVAEGLYKMHGLLYEDEPLELDAKDEEGNSGIRVGPMFLKRR